MALPLALPACGLLAGAALAKSVLQRLVCRSLGWTRLLVGAAAAIDIE